MGAASARTTTGCRRPAAIATADLEGSIAEVQRVARLGFRALTLARASPSGARTTSTIANYNLPHFDPLWAAIQDAGLPITFHISTGRDPRARAAMAAR